MIEIENMINRIKARQQERGSRVDTLPGRQASQMKGDITTKKLRDRCFARATEKDLLGEIGKLHVLKDRTPNGSQPVLLDLYANTISMVKDDVDPFDYAMSMLERK